MSRIGAAIPMREYPGKTPTVRVANPIRNIVIRNVYLRPTKSPSTPKRAAPKGRTINPAAKARRANRKPVVSSTPEKNCFEMVTASEPYKKKSYHSKMVPSDAATISFRSSESNLGNELIAANETERVSIFRPSFHAAQGPQFYTGIPTAGYTGAQRYSGSPKEGKSVVELTGNAQSSAGIEKRVIVRSLFIRHRGAASSRLSILFSIRIHIWC